MSLKKIAKQLLFISRMPKLCAILQLVSAPLNPDLLYALVGSAGACGAGSTDVEGSRHLSNSILDGKMWMLNKNNDDSGPLISLSICIRSHNS